MAASSSGTRKKKTKIITATPSNVFDLVPDDIFGDNLGLIHTPKNEITLKRLEKYGLSRETVRAIIGKTFNFDTVFGEVVTRAHPHYATGKNIVLQFDKAISILEKLLGDPSVGGALTRGTNPIETSIAFLKDQQKILAFLFGVQPNVYSDAPTPKTVKQMLQFQAFLLYEYMKHVVKSYYKVGGSTEEPLTDTRIYALILELFQKIYTHPAYGTKTFNVAKMKELCEIHKLDVETQRSLEELAKSITEEGQ